MSPQDAPPQQQQTEDRQPSRMSGTELLQLIAEQGMRESYGRQIVEAELERNLFEQDKRLAAIFAQCGAFDDLKRADPRESVALAMAKIQMGRSWGIGPADSMRFVFFTNGKPSLETDVIASKLQDAGWDWDIEWSTGTDKKCTGCTLWLKRLNRETGEYSPKLDRDGKPVSVSFTKVDSDNAKYFEKGEWKSLSSKWNYQSWPRDMYFSRCISRVRKYHAPNVLRGGGTPDESADYILGDSDSAPPQQGPPMAQVKTEEKTEALGARMRRAPTVASVKPVETAITPVVTTPPVASVTHTAPTAIPILDYYGLDREPVPSGAYRPSAPPPVTAPDDDVAF